MAGFKFRRQHPILQYVADFVCFDAKLVVEVDGDSHFKAFAMDRDHQRTQAIEAAGFRVMRVTNQDVRRDLNAVLDSILAEIHHRRRS